MAIDKKGLGGTPSPDRDELLQIPQPFDDEVVLAHDSADSEVRLDQKEAAELAEICRQQGVPIDQTYIVSRDVSIQYIIHKSLMKIQIFRYIRGAAGERGTRRGVEMDISAAEHPDFYLTLVRKFYKKRAEIFDISQKMRGTIQHATGIIDL